MASYRRQRYQTQKSPHQRFLSVFGIVFVLVYIGLGAFVIFSNNFPFNITYEGRLALGIILIVYGLLRFVRFWQAQKD